LIVDVLSLNPLGQAEVTQEIFEAQLPIWTFIVSILIYLLLFIYLWFSYQTIGAYREIIRDKFSSIERINLDWLSFIIRFFVVITIIAMIHNSVPALGNITFSRISLLAMLVFTFYFANKVLLKALNQSQLFSGINLDEKEKYTGSKLDADELDTYKSRISTLMIKEKLFLNPDLSIQELANILEITPKVLSQAINQGFGQKFYDFINSYRCEEVKKILTGPDKKVTIIEAMYQSGFNSKSSFNKEFKKLTGQTPSEYRKSVSDSKN
jgi:AraC-like DNA-binding protein